VGCMLVIVGTFAAFSAADHGNVPAVRWAALGLVALCLILGTLLQLKGRFDE
jgi:predicted ribosomally synthesized peptide with SipW-like signal peptide